MDAEKLAAEIEATLARNLLIVVEAKEEGSVGIMFGRVASVKLDTLEAMHGAVAANLAQAYADRLLPEGETVDALKSRLVALELFAMEAKEMLQHLVEQAAGALRGGK